jgi:hypothetical protein
LGLRCFPLSSIAVAILLLGLTSGAWGAEPTKANAGKSEGVRLHCESVPLENGSSCAKACAHVGRVCTAVMTNVVSPGKPFTCESEIALAGQTVCRCCGLE